MADFGELCPLFNTGVFNEIVFPNIKMTDISSTANALLGSNDCHASSEGDFRFGRTIAVTAAWVRKKTTAGTVETIQLMHHDSKLAAGTVFGTLTISKTITGYPEAHGYFPLTVTETDFTTAAILGLTYGTSTAATGGVYDLMVRYKEK